MSSSSVTDQLSLPEKGSDEILSEKDHADHDDVDSAWKIQEEEALEERIQHDEATEEEYRVEEAWEVATKVCEPEPQYRGRTSVQHS